METQVRTPQLVFMQPQRLIVPLFQRPYVWSRDKQWEPLWSDLTRMADRVLENATAKHYPHFLGAVVLQQSPNPAGSMQERTIIDGQQRLTTLQLLFDALHAELVDAEASGPAKRLETLVVNDDAFCTRPEDRFKVWPTNRDRPAFNSVMSAPIPVDYAVVGHADQRMVMAHQYFAEAASQWLRQDGDDRIQARAEAIEKAARELLQLVVIDLGADENAQEIFETLNARGADLTAADLIKNFVFQRLLEAGADVEAAYAKYWRDFESSFWESELSVGRIRFSRSSIFLNHWLIAQTGEEVVAREVFQRFKRYADEASEPMKLLLSRLVSASKIYRDFIEAGEKKTGSLDRVGLFAYRTGVMESEVIKPLVLFLLDPDKPAIPADQLDKAFTTIESWMVRRMLIRATTKNFNKVVADLIGKLSECDRNIAGNEIETFFAGQRSNSGYWPDDREVVDHLKVLPAYRRLGRGRLRMVLEAVEDHLRGWPGKNAGMSSERVPRGKLAIEHIMPQKWQANWPLAETVRGEGEREALIHTVGNLTLLTSRLNSKVSNGPWIGESGKRDGLERHDVLFLNRDLLKVSKDDWNESMIRSRSESLARSIAEIWPTPDGYKSGFATETVRPRHRVSVSDLISSEFLEAGAKLYPKPKKFRDQEAVVLSDGRIEWNGQFFNNPSLAAKAMTGSSVNGWYFFLVDPKKKKHLNRVRIDYLEAIAADPEPDDDEEVSGDA